MERVRGLVREFHRVVFDVLRFEMNKDLKCDGRTVSSPLVVSAMFMYAKARESLHQGRRLRVRGTQRDVSKNNCFMFHSFRT